jgi:hypothetical protein
MGQQHQQKKKIAPFRESKCAWKWKIDRNEMRPRGVRP